MRPHVTGYYQGEYMYMLVKYRLIMNYKEYTVQKTKKIDLKMIKRPYVNKRGRLILSEGQKNYKEPKRRRFRCSSYSISKSSTKCFWLGKKKKTWQEETE